MKCYVIDDEVYAIEQLVTHINKLVELKLIGSSTNPINAIEEIKTGEKPDILFLDINMPELNGLEITSLLPNDIAVIFVTGYMDYAYHAIEKNVTDFILKPFSFDRFVLAINKARNKLLDKKLDKSFVANTIFIKSGSRNKIIQIDVTKIIHVEAFDHYTYIHLLEEKHFTYLGIQEIEEKLSSKLFVRTHRSHIINMDLIKSIEGNEILMINNNKIPLTRLYKTNFFNKILPKMIKSLYPKNNKSKNS